MPTGRPFPRCFKVEGHEMSLQQALRRGFSPLALLIEDDAGRWIPYIVTRDPRTRDPRTPAAVEAPR